MRNVGAEVCTWKTARQVRVFMGIGIVSSDDAEL
jgi:hypothetical protein